MYNLHKCILCKYDSYLIGKYYNRDDVKKTIFPLFKCSNCKLYFFNRESYNEKIYLDKKLSTSVQKPRHKLLSTLISKKCKRGSILEIGAGDAHILNLLPDNRYNFTIIDYQKPINLPTNTIYIKSGINEVDKDFFGKGKFNFVIMDNIIEHLYDPQKVIKKVSQWITNDGYICISAPNRWNIKNLILLRPNFEFYYPTEHLNIFSKKSLNYLMEENKYILESVFIMPFNLFSLLNLPSMLGFPIFGIYFLYKKESIS